MSQPTTNDKSVQILLTNLEKKSQEYLEIKPSNITGQGLFTKAVLRADAYVCPMFYQVSSTGDPDRDYKKAEYGKYVNHNITPNCDLKQEGNCYVLHTRQRIEAGEELTIDYRDLPWDDAQVEDDDNSDKIMLTRDELRQLTVIKTKGECKTIYYPITQDEFDNGYVEVMASDTKDGKQLFTTRVGMERWIADESMSDRYPYYLMIRWCTDGTRIKGPGFYFISDTIPELDRVYQSFYYKGSYKFLFDQAYRIFTQDAFKTQPDVSVTEALHQRKVVMDLFTMDEVDETSMAEAAMEMFATRIKKVKEIIQKTKKVSVSDYVSMMKPGDLMVTYPLTKNLDTGSLLFRNLNTFFQGSSFTSIKMVSEDGKRVMGYSAKLNSHGELNEETIENFASVSGGMCLIRPKKISDTQRQKAVKWMRKKLKEKLGYSQKDIVKSLLAHLLHITKGAVNLDRKEIQKYSDPLICSSIVGFAYEYAGIKLQMPYSTFNIWPIDFLKSDQFEKVCCYFADGEYPEIIDGEKKEEDEAAKVQFGFGVDIDKTVGDLVTGQDSKDGLKVGATEGAADTALGLLTFGILLGAIIWLMTAMTSKIQKCRDAVVNINGREANVDRHLANKPTTIASPLQLAQWVRRLNKVCSPYTLFPKDYRKSSPETYRRKLISLGFNDKVMGKDADRIEFDLDSQLTVPQTTFAKAGWTSAGFVALVNELSNTLTDLKSYKDAVARIKIDQSGWNDEDVAKYKQVDRAVNSAIKSATRQINIIVGLTVKQAKAFTWASVAVGFERPETTHPEPDTKTSSSGADDRYREALSDLESDYSWQAFSKAVKANALTPQQLTARFRSYSIEQSIAWNTEITRYSKFVMSLAKPSQGETARHYAASIKTKLVQLKLRYLKLDRLPLDWDESQTGEFLYDDPYTACWVYPNEVTGTVKDLGLVDLTLVKRMLRAVAESDTANAFTDQYYAEESKPENIEHLPRELRMYKTMQWVLSIAQYEETLQNGCWTDVYGITEKLMGLPSDEELLQYSSSAVVTPTLESESVSAKKQQIIDYVTKYFKKFDKTPVDNAKRFADMVNKMSDKEFHEYMTALRNKKTKLAFYAPNMVSHTSIDDLLAVCKELGIKVQTKLKLQDPTTGKWFWTPDEYVVLQLPVRRAQQFVDKKIGVPDNDMKIDALTGQVTQEDRSTSFTNPEIQMTFSRGLTAVLAEFLQIRGGNPNAYAEFRRQLEETGSCSMNSIDPNFESRTARMAGVLLRSMHLDNNIVEGE